MGTFDLAFAWILEAEGVDSARPSDSGGRTRYGVTEVTLRALHRRGQYLDVTNVSDLTLARARTIYAAEYWSPVRGDDLPEPLGLLCLDAAAQHDPVDAARFFQQALNATTLRRRLKTDGVIGPKTLAAAVAIARRPEFLREAIVRCLAIRGAYYAQLVALRPKDEANLHGWLCRLFRLQAWILERHDGDAGSQGGDGSRPSPLAATASAFPSGRSPHTEDP